MVYQKSEFVKSVDYIVRINEFDLKTLQDKGYITIQNGQSSVQVQLV